MFNCLRVNETVAGIAAGYRPESAIIAEAETKLGKPVDEHKWNKAKSLAEKELGKKTGDQFYAYTMGIYKKMMGEAEEEVPADEKNPRVEIPHKPGHYQFTFKTSKGKDGKWIRRIYKGGEMNAVHDKAKAQALKQYPESYGHVCHSPQCEESVKAGEVKMIGEAEEHDEAKEEKKDPTREKLETAKDEADEKKGGPAELAADLRVSIRIEKMGIGRYKRMLSKHELSPSDEKWLKRRIEELEACVKEMEDKLPELEKKAESGAVKEAVTAEIKAVLVEVATGKYRE